jgi:acetyl-CoA carboxylase carboxyltransferase component
MEMAMRAQAPVIGLNDSGGARYSIYRVVQYAAFGLHFIYQ